MSRFLYFKLQEPRVTLKIGGESINFLVNAGVTYSVLTKPLHQLIDISIGDYIVCIRDRHQDVLPVTLE